MIKRALCVLLIATSSAMAAKVEPIDSIAAVVNDGVITNNELTEQTRLLRSQLQAKKNQIPSDNVLRKQVLQHLIDVKIQMELAKRNNITVDSTDLDNSIKNIAKNNKISVTQLRKEISRTGINWQAYRDNIKKEMILARVQQKAIGKEVKVSDEQVNSFIKNNQNNKRATLQYHLKNILVPLSDSPSSEQVADAKAKAEKIVKLLNKGEDFGNIAIAESSGEYALEGGDLGFRNLASLPGIFSKQAVTMKTGQIAGPIRASNGFHIIKLVAIKDNQQKHMVKLTKVRHILIKQDASMTEQEAKRQAENLYQQVMHGKSFSSMAKKYSLDPGSAVKGGDLGWVHPGELVPEFETTMDKLSVNTISKPVKSQFGWHIIQVQNRKKIDDSKTFERQQVQKMLYQRKFTEAVQNWQQQLRSEAYVKIMDKKLTA